MNASFLAAAIAASYLLGAIPFGLIIARLAYKTDIRQMGSGNTGATNVWRVLGKKPGIATLALDVSKGVVAVAAARSIFSGAAYMPLACGIAAIAGHNWSVFLKGKGGKGVATSAGVFLTLLPMHMGVALAAFLLLFFSTGHVSVGSIAGSVTLLATTFVFQTNHVYRILIVLASIMILIKHIPNMKRLARGEEPKVRFR